MLTYCIAIVVLLCELWIIMKSSMPYGDKRRVCAFVFFLQFFIVLAFRDISVLADTDAYAYHFKWVNQRLPFYVVDKDERFGAGYLIFEQFIHNHISSNFLVYNIISTLIILGTSVYFFYKKAPALWIALLVFCFTGQIFNESIAWRQGLALSVSLYGYRYLIEKKYIIYLCFVFVAYCFHDSALLLLCFILVRECWKYKKWRFLIILGSVIAFVCYAQLSEIYWENKEDCIYENASVSKNYLNYIGIFNAARAFLSYVFVLLLKRVSQTKKDEESQLLFALSTLYLIVSIFSIRLFVLERFTIYLLPYVICYISMLYYQNRHKEVVRVFTVFYIIGILACFLFIASEKPEWIKLFPYKFYE